VGGNVAYVPQTAWIMNETVRENVLMGKPLEERRYEPSLRSASAKGTKEAISPCVHRVAVRSAGVTLVPRAFPASELTLEFIIIT
jgi:ATP-binding cassette, subfamily C (CFTR/MRP), member 1